MCSVLPLKKRPVVPSPLDLTLKKKKSTTPERILLPTPSTSDPSSSSLLDALSASSVLSIDVQLQLALLSQQLYLGLLTRSMPPLISTATPATVPTPATLPTLPNLVIPNNAISPVSSRSLPSDSRKSSAAKSTYSLGEDKRCEANARERNRVQNLGVQFEKLRTLLPVDEQRLSKLTILKVARAYIAYLAILAESNSEIEMEAAGIVFKATVHQEMLPRR